MIGTPVEPARSIRTQLFALLALAVVGTLLALGASSTYHSFTDSFVVPLILSRDSDAVIQNRLVLSRLQSEREHLVARLNEDRASIEAADRSAKVLKALRAASLRARPVGKKPPGPIVLASEGYDELTAMLDRQERYVGDLEKELAAGLVHTSDLVREQNALNQIRVALLRDERERLSAWTQLARIEVDLLRSDAERQARIAQRRSTEEELARLDDLLAQMRNRPLFRAVEASQTLAFVPYSQLEGVRPGASVLRCELWGFFGCTRVGAIAEVMPGEIVAQDPWGGSARGEYAILRLTDESAVQARSLRVRPSVGKSAVASAAMTSSR